MSFATSLKSVPNFTFYQNEEMPIQVHFYNGTISLEQGEDSINIEPELMKEFIKQVIRKQQQAEVLLELR